VDHDRCHGEFGTPDLWHPRAKYPREIGTPKQNTLREFGTLNAELKQHKNKEALDCIAIESQNSKPKIM